MQFGGIVVTFKSEKTHSVSDVRSWCFTKKSNLPLVIQDDKLKTSKSHPFYNIMMRQCDLKVPICLSQLELWCGSVYVNKKIPYVILYTGGVPM